MTLAKWIKTMDINSNVVIWTSKDIGEPSYEGKIYGIPKKLLHKHIGRDSDKYYVEEPPIYISERQTATSPVNPVIVINLKNK